MSRDRSSADAGPSGLARPHRGVPRPPARLRRDAGGHPATRAARRWSHAPLLSERTACEVYLKVEGANPTGSFKDRGMTVAITKARRARGRRRSSARPPATPRASAAAYAVRAGLTCAVLVPQGKIALGKLAQALAHGAQLLQVDGNFDDCLELAQKLAVDYPVTLVNSVNNDRIEGQKTAAFEVCDVLGRAPDVHCIPVGNAGNITAYWRGLPRVRGRRRHRQHRRRMFGFQAAGAAPIVLGRARAAPGRRSRPRSASATRPRGRSAEQARDDSGGLIDAVTDRAILEAYRLLARGRRRVRRAGVGRVASPGCSRRPPTAGCRAGSTVVCTVTGHGLKDPEWAISGAPAPRTVPVDARHRRERARSRLTRWRRPCRRRRRARVRVPATSANLGPGLRRRGSRARPARRRRGGGRRTQGGRRPAVRRRGRGGRRRRAATRATWSPHRAADVAPARRRPRRRSRSAAATASRTRAGSGRRRPRSSPGCWSARELVPGRGRGDAAAAVLGPGRRARGASRQRRGRAARGFHPRVARRAPGAGGTAGPGALVSRRGTGVLRLTPHRPSGRSSSCRPRPARPTPPAAGCPETVPHADAAVAAGRGALLAAALHVAPAALLPGHPRRAAPARTAPRAHAARRPRWSPRCGRSGIAAVVSGAGPTVLVLAPATTTGGTRPAASPAGVAATDLPVAGGATAEARAG